MKPGPEIRVWSVQLRRGARSRPYFVRWSVNGTERGPKTFPTFEEADAYRMRLALAARDGMKWDLTTGLPVAWSELGELDVASFCRSYWRKRAKGLKPRSRAAWAETLSRFVAAAMPSRAAAMPGKMNDLARWVSGDDVPAIQEWVSRWSPKMSSLDARKLERVHDALLVGVDGDPLSAATLRRRFTHALAVLNAAVKEGLLETVELEKPTDAYYENVATVIDMKFPNLDTMLKVVSAVRSHQPGSRTYEVMSAIGVLAGCRPSEIVMLETDDLDLPEEGFGEITISHARVGVPGYSDDPEEDGLPKARRSRRTVPAHPTLVKIIREYLDEMGIERGPIFRTRKGKVPPQSNWTRALTRATTTVGCRDLTPYDLRRFHGTWLTEGGRKYPEYARRMGHSLETFMRYYVGTTSDAEGDVNEEMSRALGA